MKTFSRHRFWGILFAILLTASHHAFAFFDPTISTFISRDPIGESGGQNLFCFVHNNPIRFVDALGLRQISGHMEENQDGITYSWNYGYDLKVIECKKTKFGEANVTVRAKLQGIKASSGLKSLYQEGVWQKWDNRFKIVCEDCLCKGYLVHVKLVFVDSGEDLTITVNRGRGHGGHGAGDLGGWGTSDPEGTAGHEIGHQLGNLDEYGKVNGTDYGAGYQPNGGVMNNPNNSALANNFNNILSEVSKDVKGENCKLVPIGQK